MKKGIQELSNVNEYYFCWMLCINCTVVLPTFSNFCIWFSSPEKYIASTTKGSRCLLASVSWKSVALLEIITSFSAHIVQSIICQWEFCEADVNNGFTDEEIVLVQRITTLRWISYRSYTSKHLLIACFNDVFAIFGWIPKELHVI